MLLAPVPYRAGGKSEARFKLRQNEHGSNRDHHQRTNLPQHPAIEAKGPRFRLLGALVVCGGLARVVSLLSVGPPSKGHLFAFAMELGVVPLLMLRSFSTTLVSRSTKTTLTVWVPSRVITPRPSILVSFGTVKVVVSVTDTG